MKLIPLLIWGLMALFSLAPCYASGPDAGPREPAVTEVMLATQRVLDEPAGVFLTLLYTEAFKRLGIKLNIRQYPAKRASVLSDSGAADGELSRLHSYNEAHPDLVRVEEAHWTSGFLALTMQPKLHLEGWESLQDTNFRVDYQRGIKGCETNLPRVVKPENLETVPYVVNGLKKLSAGRTDLLIIAEQAALPFLHSEEFKDTGIRIAGVMEAFTSHLFLHRKHADLAPRLAAVLAEMKAAGLFARYRETAGMDTLFKD